MSLYTLLNGVAAAQTVASVVPVRPIPVEERNGLQLALASNPLDASIAVTPPERQFFQLNVSGIGTVSATAQVVGSNDGVHWINYMQVSAGSGSSPQAGGAAGQTPYAYYGAYLLSISGTSARASLTMNA